MFPLYNQFKISAEDKTYQKIYGKRHVVFNPIEKAMAHNFRATLGKSSGEDYNPDPNIFFYGGNVYHYDNSLLKSIYPSWDLRNQIMNDIEIPVCGEVRDMGQDFLCPIKYNRLNFGNHIVVVGDEIFMMHIMHPVNSSPLTNDPRRQLCIYISSNKKHNNYMTSIGTYEGIDYYPVVHKHELGEVLYSSLVASILNKFQTSKRLRRIVYSRKNSDLHMPETIEVEGRNVEPGYPDELDLENMNRRHVTVLGGQTLQTCSMLWLHIHVLLDCDVKFGICEYNTKPIHLTSYLNGNKYAW